MDIEFEDFKVAGTRYDGRAQQIEDTCKPGFKAIIKIEEHDLHGDFYENAMTVTIPIIGKTFFTGREKIYNFMIGYVPLSHPQKNQLIKYIRKYGQIDAGIKSIKKRAKNHKNVQIVITFNIHNNA